MTLLDRRTWLGATTAFVVGLATRPIAAQATEDLDAEVLLIWLRYANTVQSAYKKQYGRFADALAELNPARVDSLRGRRFRPVPAGAEFALKAVGSESYVIALRDPESGLLMWTDKTGVIQKGHSAAALNVNNLTESNSRPLTTADASMKKSRLASFVGFFMPTLHAQHFCLCGNCIGPGECGGCEQVCCNLGFQDCTWCCGDTFCCPE